MFEPIKTERLVLRRFRPDDFIALFGYLSDERVVRYEPYGVYSLAQTKREAEYRSNSEEFLAITLPDDRLIGNLYLGRREYECMELGFVLLYREQGKGYATEAATALLDYAFNQLGAHRVKASCCPENVRSWRLMERLGMRREGEFRRNVFYDRDKDGEPIWQDTYEYGVLGDEWKLSHP